MEVHSFDMRNSKKKKKKENSDKLNSLIAFQKIKRGAQGENFSIGNIPAIYSKQYKDKRIIRIKDVKKILVDHVILKYICKTKIIGERQCRAIRKKLWAALIANFCEQ